MSADALEGSSILDGVQGRSYRLRLAAVLQLQLRKERLEGFHRQACEPGPPMLLAAGGVGGGAAGVRQQKRVGACPQSVNY